MSHVVWSVCMSVSVYWAVGTQVSCAKMAEPIELLVPSEELTHKEPLLVGGSRFPV